MIGIIGSLLSGWFLGLFGFDTLVINGMMELFDLTITKTGYYFIFGLLGMFKSFGYSIGGVRFNSPKNNADKR